MTNFKLLQKCKQFTDIQYKLSGITRSIDISFSITQLRIPNAYKSLEIDEKQCINDFSANEELIDTNYLAEHVSTAQQINKIIIFARNNSLHGYENRKGKIFRRPQQSDFYNSQPSFSDSGRPEEPKGYNVKLFSWHHQEGGLDQVGRWFDSWLLLTLFVAVPDRMGGLDQVGRWFDSWLLLTLFVAVPDIYTDVLDYGWRIVTENTTVYEKWEYKEKSLQINAKEILVILKAIKLSMVFGKAAKIYFNNNTTISYVKKFGVTRSRVLLTISEEI
ncbi:hypothetical protein BB560_001582 [Smittium megazygosporum]|uniref:Uncharacterized protein n=1 Tax=Smittium megazygosporum TaxID=133381 RepID=A0A2T9ZH57_9FUNG|nr:hypothetical protein BB560_001582 [Smittium megazygosporum]